MSVVAQPVTAGWPVIRPELERPGIKVVLTAPASKPIEGVFLLDSLGVLALVPDRLRRDVCPTKLSFFLALLISSS
jgi:hypothetical protein